MWFVELGTWAFWLLEGPLYAENIYSDRLKEKISLREHSINH